ncbi:cytosine deaminase [Shouchella clausii]|uniref:cytosine deaminase n=1 Tax=Shouchella TaxID=2893057 RepID=UPI0004E6A7B3|nr:MULTISPECIES: cytosine deaminase [Shouchella]ALA52976.1 Cytosine deaminase [Shouchella clausii]MBU3231463.1 cytosine deaminase [Shouchella clausii]MBU3263534.1 cytosine deaminase [Shouchella clausii]MBU3507925.1 cytosine deaminase [Shouchella clausii]MBU3536245.1 cytosine deaminase [Shouchella clausii]
MIIKQAALRGKDGLWDIWLKDGKIAKIAQNIEAEGEQIIEADGNLVIPPFIEPHIHLDSTLTAGDPNWNLSGTLFEGIQRWSERKEKLTHEDVKERATKALKWQISQGIQHVRTHVDTTDPHLTALKALLEVKEEMKPFVDIQLVAFPQEGILSYPQGQELLEEALKLGADVVGGIPHYEFTREMGVKSVEVAFKLAEKYDKLLDFHCDETDDEQSRFIENVAALAYQSGMKERVTASHTTAMHSYNGPYVSKLLRVCQLAELNFIANPLVNTHLQGRFDHHPVRRGITRVKQLHEAGLNVCFGHDDIFDPWYPLGTGNMLQVLFMGLHVSHLTGYEQISQSLDFITENSAKTLHITDEYGIEEGKPANVILVDEKDEFNLIRRQAPVLASIRNGKIIAKTAPAQTTVHLHEEEQVRFSL